VTSGTDPGSVVAVDPATRKTVGSPVEVGASPASIAISPDGTRAYVANWRSSSVSVLELGETITVLPKPISRPMPSSVAVTPDGTRVLVGGPDDPEVTVIDVAANPPAVLAAYDVWGSTGAIAVAARGTLGVVTSATNALHAASVLDLTGNVHLSGLVKLGRNPNAVAVTSDGALALVSDSADNSVWAIALTGPASQSPVPSGEVVATIPTGQSPSGIAIAPDDSYALVSCLGVPNLTVIMMGSWSTMSIPVGSGTSAVAIAPDGSCWVVTTAAGAHSYVAVL
jgi:YVTN family beta-propeller protein